MNTRENLLREFVEDVLNKNNEWHNADLRSENFYEKAYTEKVSFRHHNRELYNKLLVFCAENNLTVISTEPGTLATVVRVEL